MEDETIVLGLLITSVICAAVFGYVGAAVVISSVLSGICIGLAIIFAVSSLVFLYDFVVN